VDPFGFLAGQCSIIRWTKPVLDPLPAPTRVSVLIVRGEPFLTGVRGSGQTDGKDRSGRGLVKRGQELVRVIEHRVHLRIRILRIRAEAVIDAEEKGNDIRWLTFAVGLEVTRRSRPPVLPSADGNKKGWWFACEGPGGHARFLRVNWVRNLDHVQPP